MTNRRSMVYRTVVSSMKVFASVLLGISLLVGMAFGQERFGELRRRSDRFHAAPCCPNISS